MSDYFQYDELKALLPAAWLLASLDDDQDGELAEMFDSARTAATNEVNGKVGLRYALPLVDPVPQFVKTCALYFACEICYGRRQQSQQFPFAKMVEGLRRTLDDIASGKTTLYPTSDGGKKTKANAQAAVVGSTSRIHSDRTNA